ncbi:MAG TPA: carboxypeptidase M32 [Alphaproteobacteria bacterium]|jgi:carboxypeptidase Taq|nr:carboxypeptidase M32 [Alphaproteobacteria bacterium]
MTDTPLSAAYSDLEQRFARAQHIDDALELLEWDHATMMPDGGAPARAQQMSTLRLIRHELMTDPALGELLQRAQSDIATLDDWQQANLAAMRRAWVHAAALPARLVEALSHCAAECEMIWRNAREANDFPALAPKLAELLQLTREAAAAKAEHLNTTPYDALLDAFDPGMTTDTIDRLFTELESFLPTFLPQVIERQRSQPKLVMPAGPFPVEAQRALASRLMTSLGFDFTHGRLDVSHHPFSSGVPGDVRVTTRYSEDEFLQGLMAVLHETGHALYTRGLPPDWQGQPVGEALGMTLHESQSLIIEMQACRSDAFIHYVTPQLAETFGKAGNGTGAWTTANIKRLFQQVKPGLIRVYADEVTYPLHVILRYRLERALIAGDLAIAELPGAWNEGMSRLLGISPPDDADGCMQDVHWPAGLFGYFPTYTLGALAASQFMAAAQAARPDMPDAIAKGDFTPLTDWLRTNVHRYGSKYGTNALLEKATGSPLSSDAYIQHLKRRYLPD